MPSLTRQEEERLFHDRQAAARAESFASGRADLRVDIDAYLDHESWIRPSIDSLGDLKNQTILDYGCGHGMASVVFAKRGARVTAFDLSPGYIAEVRTRAEVNGVAINAVVAEGEWLPFPDASFDAIWGNAILHHLDLDRAGREILRVLKPGGKAVFCEPWGGNPVLALARKWLPYPGKHRTRDEQPLTSADLKLLQKSVPEMTIRGHQLLSMFGRVLQRHRRFPLLEAWDQRLFQALPGLRKYARYVEITLRKG